MARSAEKAMTALARFRKMKMEENKIVMRRPYLATSCNTVRRCEKWRRQIIGEISRKVAQIQNAGLVEHQIRDLNDEINKLLREKGHWEDRIKELGGPDYRKIGPKMLDHEGKAVPGNRGYKYFGAAKDLPGVRELFEQGKQSQKRKTRAELMRHIDADYYGYRDEDDGILLPLEEEVEEKLMLELEEARKAAIANGELIPDTIEDEDIYTNENSELNRDIETVVGTQPYVAHVPIPSKQDVENAIIKRKKRELLEQYASEALQSAEAKTLGL